MATITINRKQTWDQMLAPISRTRRGTYTFIQLGQQGRRVVGDASVRGYIGKLDDFYISGGCEINHADFDLTAGAEIVARGDKYEFFNFEPAMKTSVGLGDSVLTGARHVNEGLRPYNLSLRDYRAFARRVAPGKPRAVARRPDEAAALLE